MDIIILHFHHYFSRFKFVDSINALSGFWVIFIIFLCTYLGFVPNGNEETYLQLAKQFTDPNWIPNSHSLTEFPGTRLFYQYIVGYSLQYLSFENTVFIYRLILISGYSFILSKIYKLLAFSNIQLIFHLVLLFLPHQSYFAGSWMFVTVEAKGFAYLFILLAFYGLLQARYNLVYLSLFAATCFHILIGGYVTFFVTITLLMSKVSPVSLFKRVGIYFIFILPFLYYISSSVSAVTETNPPASWIYTYFRNPYHTALFLNVSYFYQVHFYGILLTGIALIFSFIVYPLLQLTQYKLLNTFVILSVTITLLFVPVAYFDKTGYFLKFYLYRINTISVFVVELIFVYWLFRSIHTDNLKAVSYLVLLLACSFLLKSGISNIEENYTYSQKRELNDVCAYLKFNTPKNAVILSFEDDLTITRKSERDRFAVYKFVPAQLSKLHDWYNRVLLRDKVLNDVSYLAELDTMYQVDYVLTKRAMVNFPFLKLKFSNEKYYLYKINK